MSSVAPASLRDGTAVATEAIDLLLELCELDPPEIGGAVLADRFAQAGERLIAWGVLRSGANVATVTCRTCHDDHPAEVEFDRTARAYRHYCPEADWVPVPDEDLRRYRLDLSWLVTWLSRALSIPSNLPPRCLVDDILWDLGEAVAGERGWTALFGRRLAVAANRDHLVDALERRAGKAPGSCSRPRPISAAGAGCPAGIASFGSTIVCAPAPPGRS